MTLVARLSALVLAFCLALPAMAMSLDAAKNALESAKSQGLVGETPTGYLASVNSGSKAQEIVSAINDARREAYNKIAEKHGIAVTKVETVAGQKAVEKTPSGQYIRVDEHWIKK
ncbi:MAG: YdbL family protein [Marinobacter sp.]